MKYLKSESDTPSESRRNASGESPMVQQGIGKCTCKAQGSAETAGIMAQISHNEFIHDERKFLCSDGSLKNAVKGPDAGGCRCRPLSVMSTENLPVCCSRQELGRMFLLPQWNDRMRYNVRATCSLPLAATCYRADREVSAKVAVE